VKPLRKRPLAPRPVIVVLELSTSLPLKRLKERVWWDHLFAGDARVTHLHAENREPHKRPGKRGRPLGYRPPNYRDGPQAGDRRKS